MAEAPQDQGDTIDRGDEEFNRNESVTADDESDEVDSEEDEDEEEDEPKLKYARLTSSLGPVYRNGDATSAFVVAGDKMVIGTHNGNIHVISLPSFKSLRVYHAHSASVSSISLSPFPPHLPNPLPEGITRLASQTHGLNRSPSLASDGGSARTPRGSRAPTTAPIPNIPANAIYIATSSIDGNVCVQSLVDVKDVQVRNFARPLQAVGISPEYKNDRMYLSGGLAGNLVLTVGGKAGTSSTSTTTGTASATASGWLGTIGLGGNAGKDTVLHSGEGPISIIKWSLSGKYVVWVNERGIKIMRSSLHLESIEADSSWKRIGHIDRPDSNGWEEMAGVWKARVEWIDEKNLETDEDDKLRESSSASLATAKLKEQASKTSMKIEKLLVGWGDSVWIINVHPGAIGVGKDVGERSAGRAEIIKILRTDCIISGLSLYTPTLLLVLAYITPEENYGEEDAPKSSKGLKYKAPISSESRGGIRRRKNALEPELRLIDLNTSQEVDTDHLAVSRFESLSATDYHLGILPAVRALPIVQTSRGTLEALAGMGSGMWNATVNATNLLSSAASTHSNGSGSGPGSVAKQSAASSMRRPGQRSPLVHPHIGAQGMKIFMHSPYDCILGTKRDLSDHLAWLLEHNRNQEAWELIDESPEVISSNPEKLAEIGPATPDARQESSDDFFDDASTVQSASKLIDSAVNKEKRHIGELWIQQLIKANDWTAAGKVCARVLETAQQWEEYVYIFVGERKFDEITPYVPTTQLRPPLKSEIYGVILGHYITKDRPRVRELLDSWPPYLFNIKSVTTVLENQLKYRDVREDSIEDGEVGRDWRIVMEGLGKLHVAAGRSRDALKCYIQLQDADAAMSLIRDFHLVDAVADDIPGLIMLRVSKAQAREAPIEELRDATSEAISLLVNEAQHGLVSPKLVTTQLEAKGMLLYEFFYMSSLWRGDGIEEHQGESRDRLISESKALVDELADLAVHLFALYDRDLLMDFLKSSTFYTFEKATQECEDRDYIPELVYLYSKTGQTKRALYLIIDRLADVSQAIAFAKEQDDTDLWEDLLEYSMDKPRFIRGLLEEVGTAINPIHLVRRIPEGLEIEGLREGLSRMIHEYEIQHSISSGVARVLRGEVALAQNTLRSGQRKGVKFDVVHKPTNHIDVEPSDLPTTNVVGQINTPREIAKEFEESKPKHQPGNPKPGHCVGCLEPFSGDEMKTLVGFACGHVFHLGHLLNYQSMGESRPETPADFEVNENGEWREVHSVGNKVTHARLLRDQIRDGCPVCKERAAEV